MVERIRQIAGEKGKSLLALEKELGFGRGTIAKWDKHSPGVGAVCRVADALEVSLEYLVFGRENRFVSAESEVPDEQENPKEAAEADRG